MRRSLLDAGRARLSAASSLTRWLTAEALPARLAGLSEPAELHLETARESLVVAPVARPQSALGWGCDRNGIVVRSAPFGSWQMSWSGTTLRAVPPAREQEAGGFWALEAEAALHPDAKGALRFGIEPRFGVYADLTIATEHGNASQRLRWIAAGAVPDGLAGDGSGAL